MKEGRGSYMPPTYVPLGGLEQSDSEAERDENEAVMGPSQMVKAKSEGSSMPQQWTSGICACCDDPQSCFIGLVCPCFLFGRNAQFLGAGTFMGSCMTHFIFWGLVNTLCCLLTEGVLLGLPGCFVSCYACGYRRTLRSQYNLQEAPCGDFVTHCFCHLCATCQEYREIRERSGGANAPGLDLVEMSAPPRQTMELATSS